MSTNFAYVSSKLGAVKPETKSIAHEIYIAAAKAGHDIWFMWGMGTSGDHRTGNALDLMVKNEAAGDWVRNYIWANRKRLRLRHVIWEQHITSTVVQPGVRRLMADRGNSTENHFDHNHVLFYPGPYQAPSSGSTTKPVVLKPKPSPTKKPVVKVRVLRLGSKGADVKALQAGLNRVFPGYPGKLLTVDGDFGLETEKDVLVFQGRAGLTKDGEVGPKTRAALRKHGIRL